MAPDARAQDAQERELLELAAADLAEGWGDERPWLELAAGADAPAGMTEPQQQAPDEPDQDVQDLVSVVHAAALEWGEAVEAMFACMDKDAVLAVAIKVLSEAEVRSCCAADFRQSIERLARS